MKNRVRRVSIQVLKEDTEIYAPKIVSSQVSYHFFKEVYEHEKCVPDYKEYFFAAFLNNSNVIVEYKKISEGGITGTVVDSRELFVSALNCGATSIVLCHNHPSGNKKPSQADLNLTSRIKEAGKLLEISVLDHIILCGDSGYYSFADEGDI